MASTKYPMPSNLGKAWRKERRPDYTYRSGKNGRYKANIPRDNSGESHLTFLATNIGRPQLVAGVKTGRRQRTRVHRKGTLYILATLECVNQRLLNWMSETGDQSMPWLTVISPISSPLITILGCLLMVPEGRQRWLPRDVDRVLIVGWKCKCRTPGENLSTPKVIDQRFDIAVTQSDDEMTCNLHVRPCKRPRKRQPRGKTYRNGVGWSERFWTKWENLMSINNCRAQVHAAYYIKSIFSNGRGINS